MFTAFMVALTLTSVANVLVTLAAGPLFTALVARIFLGYRIPRRTWIAIVVAGCGIAWMFGSQLQAARRRRHAGGAVRAGRRRINWTVIQRSQAQGRNSTWCRPCWWAR